MKAYISNWINILVCTDITNISLLFGLAKAAKDAQNTKALIIVVDDFMTSMIYLQNLANTNQKQYKHFFTLIAITMTIENIELIKTISKKLCENYDFADPLDYIDIDELKECEDVYDIVQLFTDANDDREITDTDIIYYTTAMDYLKENDASLHTSL